MTHPNSDRVMTSGTWLIGSKLCSALFMSGGSEFDGAAADISEGKLSPAEERGATAAAS